MEERITGIPSRIDGPSAWKGADLVCRDDWIEHLSDRDIDELEQAVAAFRRAGADLDSIGPDTFRLPTLGPRLRQILGDLLHGRGFVLIRGFPVDRYTADEAAIAYLGVGAHLGSFRSQNAAGHLLGHVRDTGASIAKPTTRYYQTNRELEYHTDSCDIVGLLCLKTSQSGGESRIVSSVSLYNAMMERRPDLVDALFHAFPTDRRGEVPAGAQPWFDLPVFNWHDGRLTTIFVGQYIRSAQQNFPEARRLTAIEREALDLLDRLADDPSLRLPMAFLPGDMQFLHNHQILHSRTDFVDWPELSRRRHLLRLWLAPKEGRSLPESFAVRYGSIEPGRRGGIVVEGTELTLVVEPS